MIKSVMMAATASAALMLGTSAHADNANECGEVGFAQMPWTGVSGKTETAAWMMEQLGYDVDVGTGDVSIVYQSVANGKHDASFGLWLPVSRTPIRKHMLDGNINIVGTNIDGARLTLAVPDYVQEAGVEHHSDLDDFRDRFDGKIYGLEPGTDNNEKIKNMIADDAYGLGDWELVESSEAGMLAQVQRKIDKEEWVAFVGWTPHPMNLNIDMSFVDGADEYWGPDGGRATVHTFVNQGFAWRCLNLGQFLKNYRFTLQEQSELAKYIINDEMDYADAGRRLIRENPELLERWFGQGGMYQDGPVMTAEGEDEALAVIREALDI